MKKKLFAALGSVLLAWVVAWLKGITPIDVIVAAWLAFSSFASACWSVLTESTRVPNWLLGSLALLSTYTVAKIIEAFKKSDGPDKHAYIEDRFDGLVWKWRYNFDGSIHDPWCFCPDCDGILVYSEDYKSDWSHEEIMNLTCEHCRTRKGSLSGHRAYNVDRIRRLIDRKIRVGEWRAVLERQKEKP